jgi:hypothetical protein
MSGFDFLLGVAFVVAILGAITSILRWRWDVGWREGNRQGLATGYLDGRRAERSEQERIRQEVPR